MFANKAMIWIHHSIGYIVIVGPLLSILLSYLTKKLVIWHDNNSKVQSNCLRRSNANSDECLTQVVDSVDDKASIIALNLKECYYLAIAGCLLHFQIDHLFEENGQDQFYLWILST